MSRDRAEGDEEIREQAGKIRREEADQFWDHIPSESARGQQTGEDVLTYEQARDQGLIEEDDA